MTFRALLIGGSKQPNINAIGVQFIKINHAIYKEEASDEVYLLEFSKNHTMFVWQKIGNLLPRAIGNFQ